MIIIIIIFFYTAPCDICLKEMPKAVQQDSGYKAAASTSLALQIPFLLPFRCRGPFLSERAPINAHDSS